MHKFKKLSEKFLVAFLLGIFSVTSAAPQPLVFAQEMSLNESVQVLLPSSQKIVKTSPRFKPLKMLGIKFYPDNPFRLDFVLDKGDSSFLKNPLKKETYQLINYFLTALTVPDEEKWVNLSPYESDRIVPDALGSTAMGRDLLEQDYFLKQFAASIMFPEEDLGRDFWERVYSITRERFGTSEFPLNSFNKVWIIPEESVVYERANTAWIVKSHLKVMLEEDYYAKKASGPIQNLNTEPAQEISQQVMKEIIIPAIEQEVNENANFANLRQIYQAIILAAWFKQKIQDSIIADSYVGKNLIEGIGLEDKEIKNQIYNRYIEAFTKGVYDYIKEDYDPVNQEVIYRKYFSGGAGFVNIDSTLKVTYDLAQATGIEQDEAMVVEVALKGHYQNTEGFNAEDFAVTVEGKKDSHINKAIGTAVQKMEAQQPDKYKALVAFIHTEMDKTVKSSEEAQAALRELFNYLSYAKYLGVSRETVKKIIQANQLKIFTISIGGKKEVNFISPKSVAFIDERRREVLNDVENQYFLQYGEPIALNSVQDLESWYLRKDFLEKFPLIKQDTFDTMKDIWFYQVKAPDIGLNTRFKYIPPVEIERLKNKVVKHMRSEKAVSFIKKYGFMDEERTPQDIDYDMAFSIIQRIKAEAFKVSGIQDTKGYSIEVMAQKIRENKVDYIDLNIFGRQPDYFIPLEAINPIEETVQNNLKKGKEFLEQECGIVVNSLADVKNLISTHAVDHNEFVKLLGVESVSGFKNFENTVPLKIFDISKPTSYMPRHEAFKIIEREHNKFKFLRERLQKMGAVSPLSTKKELIAYLQENWLTADAFLAQSQYRLKKTLMNSIAQGKHEVITMNLLGFGAAQIYFKPKPEGYGFEKQSRGIEELIVGTFYRNLFNSVDGINPEGIIFLSEILAKYFEFDAQKASYFLQSEEEDKEKKALWQSLLKEDLAARIVHRLHAENEGDSRLIIERIGAMIESLAMRKSGSFRLQWKEAEVRELREILRKVVSLFQELVASKYKLGEGLSTDSDTFMVAAHLLQKRNLLFLQGSTNQARLNFLLASRLMNNENGANRMLIIVPNARKAQDWIQTGQGQPFNRSDLIFFDDLTEDSFEKKVQWLDAHNKRIVIVSEATVITNIQKFQQLYADYITIDNAGFYPSELFTEANQEILSQLNPNYRVIISNEQEFKNQTLASWQSIRWLSNGYGPIFDNYLGERFQNKADSQYRFLFNRLLAIGNPSFLKTEKDLGYYQELLSEMNSVFFDRNQDFKLEEEQKHAEDEFYKTESARKFKEKINGLSRGTKDFEKVFLILEKKTTKYLDQALQKEMLSLFQKENNGYAFDFLVEDFKGFVISRVNRKFIRNPHLKEHKEDLISAAVYSMMYGLYKFNAEKFPHIKIQTYITYWIDQWLGRARLDFQEDTLRLPVRLNDDLKYLSRLRYEIQMETGKEPILYEEFVLYEKELGGDFKKRINKQRFVLLNEIRERLSVSLQDDVRLKNDKGGSSMGYENLIGESNFLKKQGLSEYDKIMNKDFMYKLFAQLADSSRMQPSSNAVRDLKILAYLLGYDAQAGQMLRGGALNLQEVANIYKLSRERIRTIALQYEKKLIRILKNMEVEQDGISEIVAFLRTKKQRKQKGPQEDFASASHKNPGGIDLKLESLIIRTSESLTKIEFDQFRENLEFLRGFSPIILDIHTAVNVSTFLGL